QVALVSGSPSLHCCHLRRPSKPAPSLLLLLLRRPPTSTLFPYTTLFRNSGSEANDSVIKLVWYYNNSRGLREKKKIISRQKAYHGVTVAAASLTGLPPPHNDFDLPIKNILHTSCPHYYRFGKDGDTEEE